MAQNLKSLNQPQNHLNENCNQCSESNREDYGSLYFIWGLYFYLLFLPWIRTLCSTYYTLLLTLTFRNQDSRGNYGKRIKPHFCWVGSLPHPPQQPLSIKPSTKGGPRVMGWDRLAGKEAWDIHGCSRITSWTHYTRYHLQTQKWS